MIWNEIVCFGDSLTYGARDEYGLSYPSELSKYMSEKTGEFYVCHNYGINGETSADLIRRSWDVMSKHKDAKILLLMIGTNDTKKPTPVEIYKENISYLVRLSRVHGKKIYLALLPELGFSPHYINNTEYVEKYNNCLQEISEKFGCPLVDMRGTEDFYIDGVHYNHDGYKELARRWGEVLWKGK